MVGNMEYIGESRVRERFETTIPIEIREYLKVNVGEFLKYYRTKDGNIIIKRATLKAFNHNRGV